MFKNKKDSTMDTICYIDKFTMQAKETQDAFIFSVIEPFMHSVSSMEISKEELVQAIRLIRLQREVLEKYRAIISNDWNTAVQQSAALADAYNRGYSDATKQTLEKVHNYLEIGRSTMNNTTKINILAYASEPDKNYNYDGDIVEYEGKRYFVSLAEERVEFVGIVREEK